MRALILSGAGRYADPWHPYAATSELVARALTDAGFTVTIEEDVDGGMTRLDGVGLLVVNAGDPWRGDDRARPAPAPAPESLAGLDAALGHGLGVLALHAAVASLRDYPAWAPAVGAMWVPGLSWHPPAGQTLVHVRREAAEGLLADVSDFTVFDERYLRLQSIGRSSTVCEVEQDGTRHPVAWVRRAGRARVACDVLGHDERSYASLGHQRLVQHLARWAARA